MKGKGVSMKDFLEFCGLSVVAILLIIVSLAISLAIFTGVAALCLWLLSLAFGFTWTWWWALAIGGCLMILKMVFFPKSSNNKKDE